MTRSILFLILLFGNAALPQPLTGKFLDLTHSFDSTTIYWPTEKGFVFEKGFEGFTPKGYFYTANRFWTPEHGGTHIDAPIHFAQGRQTLDQVPLERLIGEGMHEQQGLSDYCERSDGVGEKVPSNHRRQNRLASDGIRQILA
jgi:hypothetical protein